MDELLLILGGAAAAAVLVFAIALIEVKTGDPDPARSSWIFFGVAGVIAFVGVTQRNLLVLGAGAGGLSATAAVVWWSARRAERRDAAAAQAAEELGLVYERSAPSTELLDLASKAADARDGRKIEHVLVGRWRGNDVSVFDFHYRIEGADGGALHRNFSCAIVAAPLGNESVTIRRETRVTRFASKLGVHDLEFGDPDFDKLFLIRGPNARTARDVLGTEARSWLMQNGGDLSFLVGSGAVLCMAKAGAAQTSELLDLVTRFRDVLSPSADDRPHPAPAWLENSHVAGDESPDRSSQPSKRIGVGLVVAMIAPIALAIGFYVLFYVACATGRRCL